MSETRVVSIQLARGYALVTGYGRLTTRPLEVWEQLEAWTAKTAHEENGLQKC